jgi:hypothetical protein
MVGSHVVESKLTTYATFLPVVAIVMFFFRKGDLDEVTFSLSF